MKLIKVDGTIFLGNVDENAVTDAMQLGTGNLASNLDGEDIGRYFMAENLGELTSVQFGTTSAIMSRELTEDEEQLVVVAKFAMKTAKRKAVLCLENDYFNDSYSGN